MSILNTRGRNFLQDTTCRLFWLSVVVLQPWSLLHAAPGPDLPQPIQLDSGWMLQDAAVVGQGGDIVSSASYQPAGWHGATVPGTVLTSLVNDGVYPDPLYGENNRTNIPDSLCRTTWWYRTVFTPPAVLCWQARLADV